ncbi:hypothetical protein IP90_02143 [Luteimonas cucumeris]|uniref:Transmembrane protein n=1 Tax=Luteimonas cucumeris TaxID=985012 RepID=A0A562L5V4_9GAMM|nr:hypothetical protein [Luteimonas cucumeris]TWI03040.1 hypothetical protein IP90_02143 [Luteimonas cucumeris]
MNPLVSLNLALILFLPWLLILGVLYWLYPRQPRDGRRRLYDSLALASSLAAFVLTMWWSHGYADPRWGGMWKQVLATSVAYGAFLLVLAIAYVARARWLARG